MSNSKTVIKDRTFIKDTRVRQKESTLNDKDYHPSKSQKYENRLSI